MKKNLYMKCPYEKSFPVPSHVYMSVPVYVCRRVGVGVYKRTFHQTNTLDLSSEKIIIVVWKLIV